MANYVLRLDNVIHSDQPGRLPFVLMNEQIDSYILPRGWCVLDADGQPHFGDGKTLGGQMLFSKAAGLTVKASVAAETQSRLGRRDRQPLVGGVYPLAETGSGQIPAWINPATGNLGAAGFEFFNDRGSDAKRSAANRDVMELIGAEGQIYQPASALAPVAYAKAVDDGLGAVAQVFFCDGSGEYRLTASLVDCHAPRFIAPGIIAYGRSDGAIGIVRAPRSRVPAGVAKIHLLHGQSLAGGSSTPNPSTLPVMRASVSPLVLMFADSGGTGAVRSAFGSSAANPSKFAQLVPAKEAIDPVDAALSETGMTAFGFAVTRSDLSEHIVTATGIGGSTYAQIKKGTVPYANMLYGVARAVALKPGAIVADIHWRKGETDETDSTTTVVGQINEFHSDATADIMALTGQASVPVMTLQQIGRTEASGDSGQSAYKIEGPGEAVGIIATGSDASKVVAFPQYIMDFGDVYHMIRESYVVGEAYVEKALRLHRVKRWRALQAVSAVRTSKTIKVKMAGGWLDWGGDLTIDTSWVTDPGQFGVVYRDDTQSTSIARITVTGKDELTIVLLAVPSGSNPALGFAFWRSSAQANQGRAIGLRCCIRDNDPHGCPVTGRPLHNYVIGHTISVGV